MQGVASRQEITEAQVQELEATSAHTVDKLDNMSREVCSLTDRMSTLETAVSSGFSEMKSILQQGEFLGSAQSYGQEAMPTFNSQHFPFSEARNNCDRDKNSVVS